MSTINQQSTEKKEDTWLQKAGTVAAATALTAGIVITTMGPDILDAIIDARNSKNKSKVFLPVIGASVIVGIAAVVLEDTFKSLRKPDTKALVQEHAKLQSLTQHTSTNR